MYKIAQKSKFVEKIEDSTLEIVDYNKIVQLGIQAPSGSHFIINGENTDSNGDIEIGITGIFELDLKDTNTYITSVAVTAPVGSQIIVDILYEG